MEQERQTKEAANLGEESQKCLSISLSIDTSNSVPGGNYASTGIVASLRVKQ